MKASYRRGIAYIALNDEPHFIDAEDMRGFASVHVLAEVFDKDEMKVAEDVIRYRMRLQDEENRMQGPHDITDESAAPSL